jgi:hypothetical protein
MACLVSGVLLISFLLFVAEGFSVGRWNVAWLRGVGALLGLPIAVYVAGKATRVQFDRKTGNLTIWRSRKSEPTSQLLLANLSAVRLFTLTFPWTVHQLSLFFENPSSSVLLLRSRNGAKVASIARQLVDFLGVPLIQERYGKWGELVQRAQNGSSERPILNVER